MPYLTLISCILIVVFSPEFSHLQLIAAACLFLHHEYLNQKDDINLLCSVTFVAYTIILLVLIVGKLMINYNMMLCFVRLDRVFRHLIKMRMTSSHVFNVPIYFFFLPFRLSIFASFTHYPTIGYFISKPFSRRVDILFGVIAIPLFLASGYFILTNLDTLDKQLVRVFDYSNHKKSLAKGWLAVANGVIFILDIVFHCFE